MEEREFVDLYRQIYETYIISDLARINLPNDLKEKLAKSLQPDEIMKSMLIFKQALQSFPFLKNSQPISVDSLPFKRMILENATKDLNNSLADAKKVANETKFADIINTYYPVLVEGLSFNHIPKLDEMVYSKLTEANPPQKIAGDIAMLKSDMEMKMKMPFNYKSPKDRELINIPKVQSESLKPPSALEDAQSRLNKAISQTTKVTRNWFVGLELIGRGAAILTANIAYAIGVLDCKSIVGDSDERFKSLPSSVLGYGLIMMGSQELKEPPK
jgi:hypothetical protein